MRPAMWPVHKPQAVLEACEACRFDAPRENRFQALHRDHDELRAAAFTSVFHLHAQHPFLVLRQ